MIKKIQHYLLTRYPLLWNIRIFPVAITIIFFHILFFLIGFFVTDTSLYDKSYYNIMDDIQYIYSVSILASILVFIGWLSFYMRNNAFSSYYPLKSKKLYLEWILIFIISFGTATFFISLFAGSFTKWSLNYPKEHVESAQRIFERVDILIPHNINEYEYSINFDTIVPYVFPKLKKINPQLQGYAPVHPYLGEDTQPNPSLLYFKGRSYSETEYIQYKRQNYGTLENSDKEGYKDINHLSKYTIQKFENIDTVKKWLQDGQKDSIYTLMSDFIELLQVKNNFETNLTVDKWFNRIYNPPYFVVSPINLIFTDTYRNRVNYGYIYESDTNPIEVHLISYDTNDTLATGTQEQIDLFIKNMQEPYFEYDNIVSAYNGLEYLYDRSQNLELMILCSIYFSLIFSMLILSFRTTLKQYWFGALIAAGILFFVYFFVSLTLDNLSVLNTRGIIFFFSFWIITFLILLFFLIHKLKDQIQNSSAIALNLFLWISPFIIPMIGYNVMSMINKTQGYYHYVPNTYVMDLLWNNIPIVILFMFVIIKYIYKWKSMPEE